MKLTIKNYHLGCLWGLSIMTILACEPTGLPPQIREVVVEAPFDIPPIQVPDFTNCPHLRIEDFGAIAGDQIKTSTAIALAINRANEMGGATVVIPTGEWPTGRIHLKSNVNLHLEEGAELLFSEKPEDYLPAVHTTWEGMECYNYSPLIYAYECRNVAITGKGTLRAKMDIWQKWFARPPAHMNSLKRLYHLAAQNSPISERQMVNDTAHLRPQFIQFNRCENVLVEDIRIINSPFWTIHPYLSRHVVIRGVHVTAHGHNNDGVDPEMSQNVLIENSIFDQGDDAISVKSGRNQDAWRLDSPSKNIVIRNCEVRKGHQLIAIGSELSGGVENVYVEGCTVSPEADLFHLVFIKTNERRGGYVNNIFAHNITSGDTRLGILGIETDVMYQWRHLVPTYERRLTPITNIRLSEISAGEVTFISRILASPELPVDSVELFHISASHVQQEPHIHEHVKHFKN